MERPLNWAAGIDLTATPAGYADGGSDRRSDDVRKDVRRRGEAVVAIDLKEFYGAGEKPSEQYGLKPTCQTGFRLGLHEEQSERHKQQDVAGDIKERERVVMKWNPTHPRPVCVSLEVTPRHRSDAKDNRCPEKDKTKSSRSKELRHWISIS